MYHLACLKTEQDSLLVQGDEEPEGLPTGQQLTELSTKVLFILTSFNHGLIPINRAEIFYGSLYQSTNQLPVGFLFKMILAWAE